MNVRRAPLGRILQGVILRVEISQIAQEESDTIGTWTDAAGWVGHTRGGGVVVG